MARPIKTGIKKFPKWKPNFSTRTKFSSSDFKIRYKALRNSSSAFIKRDDVRRYIFFRDGFKCCLCGNTEKLEIDHIISVYRYSVNSRLNIALLNSENNLRTICKKCNSAKRPEE